MRDVAKYDRAGTFAWLRSAMRVWDRRRASSATGATTRVPPGLTRKQLRSQEIPLCPPLEDHLIQIVDALPEQQRPLILQHLKEGLDYKEIARERGLSVEHVWQELTHAYSTLRVGLKPLEGHYINPPSNPP